MTMKTSTSKVGLNLPVDAVARADAAMKSLSANFEEWLKADVAKLQAVRERMAAEGISPETVGQLYMRAHDLKGLGVTCEYPIITRLADSLCALLDDEQPVDEQMGLVDDHIDALRLALQNRVRSEDDPRGREMIEILERDIQYR